MLQLDGMTNVQRVQGGVFFRCRPGEPQRGYKVQVHNHFKEKPEQEYALEEYDPKTGELKEKKKAMFHAVDYGTGGIHGQVPARRRVVTDFEWATLTVVAQGRHVLVWVNGVLVTDWTDNRKTSDDARTGCRLERGAISLQGYDANTEVSFRNIRVAELP